MCQILRLALFALQSANRQRLLADLQYSSPDLDSSPDLSPFLLDLDLDLDFGSKDSDLDLDLDLEALPASPFSSLFSSPFISKIDSTVIDYFAVALYRNRFALKSLVT